MLRIPLKNKARNLRRAGGPGGGPQARIDKMRRMVTDLIRHERIQEKSFYLDESRGYVELLYQQAQRYGDQHKPTMQICDYWLLEKDLIHKLFKDLIPRFSNTNTSITRKFEIPATYPGKGFPVGVLELKGNSLPPIECNQQRKNLKGSIVNMLLDGARKDAITTRKVEATTPKIEATTLSETASINNQGAASEKHKNSTDAAESKTI